VQSLHRAVTWPLWLLVTLVAGALFLR
jgi:hypothetical protein